MLFLIAQLEEIVAFKPLLDYGGLGILAAVLLWLHKSSLSAFRQELENERKMCHDDHLRIEAKIEQHSNRTNEQILELTKTMQMMLNARNRPE